jgi:hypothetical protein
MMDLMLQDAFEGSPNFVAFEPKRERTDHEAK